ncbi:MAG: sulfurtransferase-like selenium metabolism protein YedF [Syntrophobacterales bacterium]|jgi:selenium metabolism protein YedF|nr:sulfurtransferase-like selenium metabolism protein YedF [Syntrophobacterales bacterium]
MDTLDLTGLTCPVPVIETKKFLEKHAVDKIEIVLDSDVAADNVKRFLVSHGFSVVSEEKSDGSRYILRGTRQVPATNLSQSEVVIQNKKQLLVYINTETVGIGSDELGRLLMNSFLHTLKELDVPPWRVVLLNGGVKLVVDGSEYVGTLTDITNMGTEVLSCGTCLDYFHLTDKVKVGRIGNMYEISSSFLRATHVIRP